MLFNACDFTFKFFFWKTNKKTFSIKKSVRNFCEHKIIIFHLPWLNLWFLACLWGFKFSLYNFWAEKCFRLESFSGTKLFSSCDERISKIQQNIFTSIFKVFFCWKISVQIIRLRENFNFPFKFTSIFISFEQRV